MVSRAGVHVGGRSGVLGLGWSPEGQSNTPGANEWGRCYLGWCALGVLCVPVCNKVLW